MENGHETVCRVTNQRARMVCVDVFAVMNCNFNDERLVREERIPVDDLRDQPLRWIDPFFGCGDGTEIAICEIAEGSFALFRRKGETVERIKESYGRCYLSTEGDDISFTAAHVYIGW